MLALSLTRTTSVDVSILARPQAVQGGLVVEIASLFRHLTWLGADTFQSSTQLFYQPESLLQTGPGGVLEDWHLDCPHTIRGCFCC